MLCQDPAACHLAELGVLPDPANVSGDSLGQAIRVRLELRFVVKEDEVQPRNSFGYLLVFNLPPHDRGEALVQRSCKLDFLERHLGGDRVRTDNEYDRVGARDQRLDAFPLVFESINFASVPQRLEAACLQRRLKSVGEGHVLARIGDEDFRLQLSARLHPGIGVHESVPLWP
jgi:hypothetical protein